VELENLPAGRPPAQGHSGFSFAARPELARHHAAVLEIVSGASPCPGSDQVDVTVSNVCSGLGQVGSCHSFRCLSRV
jgi:hypothetical protein